MTLEPLEPEKDTRIKIVSPKTDPEVSKLRPASARRQWTITILANLSVLSSGMALGFPAISLDQLKSTSSPTALNSDQGSWFASINTITCPLGGLLASVILDKIGRKRTLILINVLSIIAWLIQVCADKENTQTMYYQLLVARVIIGEWNMKL